MVIHWKQINQGVSNQENLESPAQDDITPHTRDLRESGQVKAFLILNFLSSKLKVNAIKAQRRSCRQGWGGERACKEYLQSEEHMHRRTLSPGHRQGTLWENVNSRPLISFRTFVKSRRHEGGSRLRRWHGQDPYKERCPQRGKVIRDRHKVFGWELEAFTSCQGF